MKHILLIAAFALAFASCKKEESNKMADYMTTVKKGLADSLSNADFQNLDFSKSSLSKVDSVNLYVLRVPFKDQATVQDFVAVKTTSAGAIEQGRIVHLEGKAVAFGDGLVKRRKWNGSIVINSLGRKTILQSPIENGYFTALHSGTNMRTSVHEAGLLPEVVITYTIQSGGGISWSTWMMVQSFFIDYGGGGSWWGGYYTNMYDNYPSGGGGGGGGGSTGGGPSTDPVILVDVENQDEKPEIDLQKFINCLNAIPDAGATCSIEILSDIPVDSDPNKIFNIGTNSPGHTFLNIRKQNGTQSASQNIGFYPKNSWKNVFTNAPIDGKFVDNGLHEFNCGYKIDITPAQLTAALTEILRAKDYKYDIDNYNCTDWAMDVFNRAGANFQIPLYDIPGNVPSLGTRMPNGVYNKLREMKNNNHPQSPNITIDILKGWAGSSTGPCN